ncbi:MAG: response regulator transcription factor [Enhydrobacter sp.]|nr:MAG: response regulator transcription factor [Enhydrobacter sp.]
MRIVLVEDDDDLRQEISEYLRRRGHDVSACATMEESRRTLGLPGIAPDAVICDMNLPDGNGADLCAEAAPRLPSCRWVLMSGAHEPDELAEKLAGIAGPPRWVVVDKPVSMRALNQALDPAARS